MSFILVKMFLLFAFPSSSLQEMRIFDKKFKTYSKREKVQFNLKWQIHSFLIKSCQNSQEKYFANIRYKWCLVWALLCLCHFRILVSHVSQISAVRWQCWYSQSSSLLLSAKLFQKTPQFSPTDSGQRPVQGRRVCPGCFRGQRSPSDVRSTHRDVASIIILRGGSKIGNKRFLICSTLSSDRPTLFFEFSEENFTRV